MRTVFYSAILHGVKEVIDPSPYRLVLLSVSNEGELKDLVSRRVCDAFICHDLGDPLLSMAVHKTGLPSVFCWREFPLWRFLTRMIEVANVLIRLFRRLQSIKQFLADGRFRFD